MSHIDYEREKEQRKESPFGEFVFMTNDHPLLTYMINKKLRKVCEKAGVQYLSTHKIRFWAVTVMYDSNLPDYDLDSWVS